MPRWLLLAVTWMALGAAGLRAQETPAQNPDLLAPQDTALERKVRDVASQLRCPVCLNLSVYDSPSEMARDMRDVVRDKLKTGETEEQVFQYYIQRYGDWILMKPPAHGVSLLVWLLPAVVGVGGVALILVAVQRWTKRTAPAAAAAPTISEEDLRRVRAEMAKERDDLD